MIVDTDLALTTCNKIVDPCMLEYYGIVNIKYSSASDNMEYNKLPTITMAFLEKKNVKFVAGL